MLGSAAPYVMWLAATLFAGACALVLIGFIRSLDPPETPKHSGTAIEKHAA